MTAYKSVAVAGGTGNLGPAIVSELLAAGFTVTVLTRSATSSVPAGATAREVDYSSKDSLVSALRGHDAVVSNLGSSALGTQPALIDAAISAGVQRFIPSEFGCDTLNLKAATLPVFAHKIETAKYLEEKAAKGEISYTSVMTGGFLDWGLEVGFLANIKDGGETKLLDGGDAAFSATTLSGIGKAVAGVLKHPEETKNRAVYVASANVSQNQLLAAAKKARPGLELKTETVSTDDNLKQAYEILNSGKNTMTAMMLFLSKAISGEGYGGKFENLDNKLLGVPQLSEKDVDELVAQYV